MSEAEFAEISTNGLWSKYLETEGNDRIEVAVVLAARLREERKWIDALSVSEAVLQIPEIQADERMMGHFYWEIGYANYSLNRLEESVSAYLNARNNYVKISDAQNSVYALRNATDGMFDLDRPGDALDAVTEAIEMAETELFLDPLGDLYRRKGMALDQLGMSEAALEAFTEARYRFQSQGDFTGMIRADRRRIQVMQELGQNSSAIELAEKLLVLAQRANDSHEIFHAVESLGTALLADDEFERLLILLDEIENYLNPELQSLERAKLLLLRAKATANLEDVEKGLKLAREAAIHAEYSQDQYFQLTCFDFSFLCARSLEDLTQMRVIATEMLAVARRLDSRRGIIRAAIWLGETLVYANEYEAAEIQFMEVSDLEFDQHLVGLQRDFRVAQAHFYAITGRYGLAQMTAEDGLMMMQDDEWHESKAKLFAIRCIAMFRQQKIGATDVIVGQALSVAEDFELQEVHELRNILRPPTHIEIPRELEI